MTEFMTLEYFYLKNVVISLVSLSVHNSGFIVGKESTLNHCNQGHFISVYVRRKRSETPRSYK